MPIFFGFAMSDSMFPEFCEARREFISVAEIRAMVAAEMLTPCVNPSHVATLDIMRSRFEIDIQVPKTAPKVKLEKGDGLVVMTVTGLPRLEGRHEYTKEEIDGASFKFGYWRVI